MKYRLDYERGGTIVLSFRLCGAELNPALITQELGIMPTRCWKVGDVRGQSTTRYQFGCWMLSPECAATESLDTQLDLLLSQLESLPSRLSEYISVFEAGITVGLTSVDTNIGVLLDQDMIQRLGRLKLWLDVDAYVVGRNAVEAPHDIADDESAA